MMLGIFIWRFPNIWYPKSLLFPITTNNLSWFWGTQNTEISWNLHLQYSPTWPIRSLLKTGLYVSKRLQIVPFKMNLPHQFLCYDTGWLTSDGQSTADSFKDIEKAPCPGLLISGFSSSNRDLWPTLWDAFMGEFTPFSGHFNWDNRDNDEVDVRGCSWIFHIYVHLQGKLGKTSSIFLLPTCPTSLVWWSSDL